MRSTQSGASSHGSAVLTRGVSGHQGKHRSRRMEALPWHRPPWPEPIVSPHLPSDRSTGPPWPEPGIRLPVGEANLGQRGCPNPPRRGMNNAAHGGDALRWKGQASRGRCYGRRGKGLPGADDRAILCDISQRSNQQLPRQEGKGCLTKPLMMPRPPVSGRVAA